MNSSSIRNTSKEYDNISLHRSHYFCRRIIKIYFLFIYQLFWTQACPEGMCTNWAQVPCEVPSLLNPTNCKGWSHHRGLRSLLFSNSDVGSFTSHKNKSVKVLWDRTYGFSSLSQKTRKSNHLQMSLQRQHFLLSYLRPWVLVWLGFEPATSHSADLLSPNWDNQAAVSTLNKDCTSVLSDQMSKTSSIQTKQNKNTVNLIKRLMKPVSTHCKQVSYFHSADLLSPNWANQAAISTLNKDCTSVLSDQMSKTSSIQTKQNKNTVNLIKRLMKAVSTHCKQVSYFLDQLGVYCYVY